MSDQASTKEPTFYEFVLNITILGSFIFGSVLVVSHIYDNTAGSVHEFLKEHPVWGTVVYSAMNIALLLIMALMIFLEKKYWRLKEHANDYFWFRIVTSLMLMMVLISPFLITVLIGFVGGVVVILWSIAEYVMPPVGEFIIEKGLKAPLIVLIVLVAIASSYGAYLARSFKRFEYGVVEVIFGLGSIVYSVYSVIVGSLTTDNNTLSSSDIWQAVFGFVAGGYIIVRGLVNIEDKLSRGPVVPSLLYLIVLTVAPNVIRRWRRLTQGLFVPHRKI